MRPRPTLALVLMLAFARYAVGCYHFDFEQEPPRTTLTSSGAPEARPRRFWVHVESVPTYVNGFVGTGRIDTYRFCSRPVRTELRVNADDVLVSIGTFLIYTPHTLYVTCEIE